VFVPGAASTTTNSLRGSGGSHERRDEGYKQDELGGPEVLELVTLPTPQPGVGEVLVRVHAASVNPVDAMNRESGLIIGQAPFVLGWDVSGTVEAVGLGVTLFAPGDEVFGMLPFPHGHGAHAQYAVGPTRVFVPKPDRS
jgi:NADPH:quinone reductase-like Zn-dependent oxidoreductase